MNDIDERIFKMRGGYGSPEMRFTSDGVIQCDGRSFRLAALAAYQIDCRDADAMTQSIRQSEPYMQEWIEGDWLPACDMPRPVEMLWQRLVSDHWEMARKALRREIDRLAGDNRRELRDEQGPPLTGDDLLWPLPDDAVRIGRISTYYGGLHVCEREGRYYWGIESYDDELRWQEIPMSLYQELIAITPPPPDPWRFLASTPPAP